jgi:hypothetical protein
MNLEYYQGITNYWIQGTNTRRVLNNLTCSISMIWLYHVDFQHFLLSGQRHRELFPERASQYRARMFITMKQPKGTNADLLMSTLTRKHWAPPADVSAFPYGWEDGILYMAAHPSSRLSHD